MSSTEIDAMPVLQEAVNSFRRRSIRRFVVLCAIVAAFSGLAVAAPYPAQAITGGSLSSGGTWSVRVFEDADPICTGALIAPRWVLTAGHCVRFDNSNITLHIGNLDQHKGTIVKRLTGETYFDKDADLALVKIPKVTTPTIALPSPRSLQDRTFRTGTVFRVFGWGATCEPNEASCQSNFLRTATVTTIAHSNAHCDYLAGIADYCVTARTGLPVGGDSGGPAIVYDVHHRPLLVGILAASDRSSTAAYGDLHQARAWITATLRR